MNTIFDGATIYLKRLFGGNVVTGKLAELDNLGDTALVVIDGKEECHVQEVVTVDLKSFARLYEKYLDVCQQLEQAKSNVPFIITCPSCGIKGGRHDENCEYVV